MIKYIITDVDGVLTDGKVTLDAQGRETKTICYRDLDAIGMGRRHGLSFIFVTGERGEMARMLAKRFSVDLLYEDVKDKLHALQEICARFSLSFEELVYVGDSDRDAPALAACQHSYCPADATRTAKKAAKTTLSLKGGSGVLWEVVEQICQYENKKTAL